MNIPSVPTDNLYKLISISGLLMLFIPTIIIMNMENSIKISLIDDNKTFHEQKYKLLLVIDKEHDILEKFGQDMNKIEKEQALEKLNSETDRIMNRVEYNMNLTITLGEIRDQKIKLLQEQLYNMQFIQTVLFWVGGIFTFFGFILWYCLIQRYQDKILKNLAQELNSVQENTSLEDEN